ncbi:hypothetical protein HPB47_007540 [Ixodes persulcatus]|uniref:Uncharacterized protein n=1 Tax=Ixodes persulcatus TaxID=34615 RepID=A0AC60P7E3_IXOPE|nr:hypothetical protein HPB47_007540 [Ixodes persulcatus]
MRRSPQVERLSGLVGCVVMVAGVSSPLVLEGSVTSSSSRESPVVGAVDSSTTEVDRIVDIVNHLERFQTPGLVRKAVVSIGRSPGPAETKRSGPQAAWHSEAQERRRPRVVLLRSVADDAWGSVVFPAGASPAAGSVASKVAEDTSTLLVRQNSLAPNRNLGSLFFFFYFSFPSGVCFFFLFLYPGISNPDSDAQK